MSTRKSVIRAMAVAVLFCVVCVIYVGRLFYVQIAGKDGLFNDGTTTIRVKAPAVRGEILDRNGVTLVSNRYTYDLTVQYAAVSALGISRANATYLRLLEALDACGAAASHQESYFPLVGTYPDYAFAEGASDPSTAIGYRLSMVLSNKGMDEDTTAKELAAEYVDGFRLLEQDESGNRLYSDYEIDRLVRLRYDMDAKRFGPASDYLFAENADLALMTYVRELGLTGIEFAVNAERVYHYPGYASHILGSVGPIYAEEWEYYNEQGYQMNALVGKSGCEAAFEEYLRGVDGELLITLDANGNTLSTEVITAPVTGKDVYLTIDISLQIAAEDGLKENVEYVQQNDGNAVEGFLCDAGAAVAMDPTTFEIYAIASHPTFDLTTYNADYASLSADPARPLSNRALRETYAPGSTFKVGVAAAGLSEGTIGAGSTVLCPCVYNRFDDYKPRCPTYPHATSSLNVTQALADSCNCFFYELGYRLGIGTMDRYLSALGFGRGTGIELGEAVGVLAGEDGSYEGSWTAGNTVAAAIGQSETKATPLQICSYISSLVNGGERYAAHLLYRVCEFGTGTVVLETAPQSLSRAELTDPAVATCLQGMKQMVADSTTARRFLNESSVSYSLVGGKTGTAQVEKYVRDEATGDVEKIVITNALFVGVYAPDNAPELTVSVVIEKASSGVYASLTAARILGAWENLMERG